MTDLKRPTKAVILAGGFGTRLTEETVTKPKPMVEIGGRPILWHIMKIYSKHGINDFVICLGYKGYYIKEYFLSYRWLRSSITVDIQGGGVTMHDTDAEPWHVTLVDTGDQTLTGGRVKRVRNYLETDRPFCLTYGDGVADIDITASIDFHMSHGRLATITAVAPPGRFGALNVGEGGEVTSFVEKPAGDGGMINGGFLVLSPKTLDYIPNDQTALEQEPLMRLAEDGQLKAFPHHGFWQPMDTLRDRNALEAMWEGGNPPWKVWE